jgi:hypothetical protein
LNHDLFFESLAFQSLMRVPVTNIYSNVLISGCMSSEGRWRW